MVSNVTRMKPRRHGVPWTESEDVQLLDAFNDGLDRKSMALRHGRSIRAICERLRFLGEKP